MDNFEKIKLYYSIQKSLLYQDRYADVSCVLFNKSIKLIYLLRLHKFDGNIFYKISSNKKTHYITIFLKNETHIEINIDDKGIQLYINKLYISFNICVKQIVKTILDFKMK